MMMDNMALVGDIKINGTPNAEYYETVLRLLQDFMIEHDIDRIDISWSRRGILAGDAIHSEKVDL